MGLSGISVSQLAIILLIVIVIFGPKRLKTLGGDLGGALRSFRNAMNGLDGADTPSTPGPLGTPPSKPKTTNADPTGREAE